MNNGEQPMITLTVGVPIEALMVDKQNPMDPMESAQNLSISENGIKIEAVAHVQASAMRPREVILWISVALGGGFLSKIGADAWDFVREAWPKIVPRIEERIDKAGMRWSGCRLDEMLPFERGKIHVIIPNVAPDDMANLFPLLKEEELGKVIRAHSPTGKLRQIVLRFHNSPPHLEVASVQGESE